MSDYCIENDGARRAELAAVLADRRETLQKEMLTLRKNFMSITSALAEKEQRITALQTENARLREALIRIEDLTSHNMGMSDREERIVNEQARAVLKQEQGDG